MVKDWNSLERTGNPAVDMVADHVFHYRDKLLKPIKSILLHPRAFRKFEEFVKKNKPDYIQGAAKLEFDSVEIIKGSPLMIKDLMVGEFWNSTAEA